DRHRPGVCRSGRRAPPMTSTLPSRWQEILRREAAANVGTVLAQAREQPGARQVPRWTMPALVVGVASLSLLTIVGGSEVKGKGTARFDRSTVSRTRSAGRGPRAEARAPPTPATLPSPPPPAAPFPAPPRERLIPRHEKPAASCPDCQRRRADMAA